MATPATDDGPLYHRVADWIADMIEGGTYRPGSRVPSLRKLSRQLAVSVTTAQEAYRLLESRGLLEARPQSGFYVRRRPSTPPAPAKTTSAIRPVDLDIAGLVLHMMRTAERPTVVSFGAAVPHPGFIPTDALTRILAREVRRAPEACQSYDSLRGYLPLREQIARRALDAGCTLAADDVVTTAGAHQAVYLALKAVTRPGDAVVVETPTYVGLLQILEALGLRALEVGTDPDDGLCLDELARSLSQETVAACVLVPTFGNPLGHSMPEGTRERLLELLAEHDLPLIEDDVYGELHFGAERPRAVKAFDRGDRVLLCSSFSKTLAPGFRVGWIAPGQHLEQVERHKYITSVASPTPTQMAIAAFLAEGGYDRHLRALRSAYCGRVARVADAVAEHFPPGTRCTRPRGGHVLWVELPEGADSLELYGRALEHGISFAPGPLFSASGRYRNFLRLNCAVPWSDAVADALRILGRLAEQAVG